MDTHDENGLYRDGPRMATTRQRVEQFAAALPAALRVDRRRPKVPRRGTVALLEAIRRRPDLPAEARAAVLAHADAMVARAGWHPRFVPPSPPPYTYAERDGARRDWARARSRGEVTPPSACECCDREGLRLQGHHTDYRRPLDVAWLCSRCHGLAHGGPRPAHLAARDAA